MKWLKYILASLCLGCCLYALGGMPTWEHVTPNRPNYEASESERIEVTVRDGYIYVNTNRPVTVKVTSIVGQLISQQNIPAGISRLKVKARGIYILKAGDFTTRVSV